MEIKNSDKTSILFESPHRLKKLLIELKEYIGCQREIQIYRELTKKFEENIGPNLEIRLFLEHVRKKELNP